MAVPTNVVLYWKAQTIQDILMCMRGRKLLSLKGMIPLSW